MGRRDGMADVRTGGASRAVAKGCVSRRRRRSFVALLMDDVAFTVMLFLGFIIAANTGFPVTAASEIIEVESQVTIT